MGSYANPTAKKNRNDIMHENAPGCGHYAHTDPPLKVTALGAGPYAHNDPSWPLFSGGPRQWHSWRKMIGPSPFTNRGSYNVRALPISRPRALPSCYEILPRVLALRNFPRALALARGFSKGSSVWEEDRVTTPVFRVGVSCLIASFRGLQFRVSCDSLPLLAATLPPILSRAFAQFLLSSSC
jgi:hypothetical protein